MVILACGLCPDAMAQEEPAQEVTYDPGNPYDVATQIVQALKDRDFETLAALAEDPDDILELQANPAEFEETIEGWLGVAIETAVLPITDVRWVTDSDRRVMAYMADIDGEELAVLSMERDGSSWVWDNIQSTDLHIWEAAMNVEGF